MKRLKTPEELRESGWERGVENWCKEGSPTIVAKMFIDFGTSRESGWRWSDDMFVTDTPKPSGTQLTKTEYLAFIEKTFAEMTTLIKAKNSDYTAGSDDPFANFRQSVDYGVDPLSGLMVRVGDKLQRIKSFTKAGKLEVANEGVEDAFKDLIGYSLIALGMLSERAK